MKKTLAVMIVTGLLYTACVDETIPPIVDPDEVEIFDNSVTLTPFEQNLRTVLETMIDEESYHFYSAVPYLLANDMLNTNTLYNETDLENARTNNQIISLMTGSDAHRDNATAILSRETSYDVLSAANDQFTIVYQTLYNKAIEKGRDTDLDNNKVLRKGMEMETTILWSAIKALTQTNPEISDDLEMSASGARDHLYNMIDYAFITEGIVEDLVGDTPVIDGISNDVFKSVCRAGINFLAVLKMREQNDVFLDATTFETFAESKKQDAHDNAKMIIESVLKIINDEEYSQYSSDTFVARSGRSLLILHLAEEYTNGNLLVMNKSKESPLDRLFIPEGYTRA